MRTGVAYLAPHNSKHIRVDLQELAALRCHDVLLAAQENDFAYFPGKLQAVPKIAGDFGMRSIAIFWGVLNLFGGGRSSQFLLDNPDTHQVRRDGTWHPGACYNHPRCVARIHEMIDHVADCGFGGYFIDEPATLDCYCEVCRAFYARLYGGELHTAPAEQHAAFRRRCVVHYINSAASYVKRNHGAMETLCCVTPADRELWSDAATLPSLDNLGTDLYWCNEERDMGEMLPLIGRLRAACAAQSKQHHLWLQCWGVRRGNERRIAEQGRLFISERPGALYVWAYQGQIGTNEACDDPAAAWSAAREVLRAAQQ